MMYTYKECFLLSGLFSLAFLVATYLAFSLSLLQFNPLTWPNDLVCKVLTAWVALTCFFLVVTLTIKRLL